MSKALWMALGTLVFLSWMVGAASAQPDSSSEAAALYQQAYESFVQGDYAKAADGYRQTTAREPNNAQAHFWLAKTLTLMKRYDEALAALSESARVGGSNKEIVQLYQKLRKEAPEAASTVRIYPPISLNLKDTDIRDVLKIFSDETGVSIVAAPTVKGPVSVSLQNVDPEQALKSILEAYGFTAKRNGDVIQVFGSSRKIPSSDIDVESSDSGKRAIRTFRISYLATDELKEFLTNIVPPDTVIAVTKGSNAILVEGPRSTLNRVEKILQAVDRAPRQVMVEAKMIETSFDVLANLGMQGAYNPIGGVNLSTNGLASAAGNGVFATLTRSNANALLETLSTKTDLNLLAAPKVVAVSGQKAEIITGTKLGYKVKTLSAAGVIESVEFLEAGIRLFFTPYIKDDGTVTMEIHPEISEGFIVDGLPQKNSTETTTRVSVRDGETVVLGGLVRERNKEVNKGVPFLQDIPLLGILFRRMETETNKREIIVLITPTILDTDKVSQMESGTAAFKRFEKYQKDHQPSLFY